MVKKKIFGKKEIKFTFFRYFVFFLQAIRTLLVAYFLGPYYLGIYGFLMLYIQYLSYSNLGIQYSLNSEISVLDSKEILEKEKLINSGFTGILFNSILLVFIGIIIFYSKINLFPFEDSYKYIFVIIFLTIFNHFQKLFVTIFRIEKKLTTIIKGEFVVGFSLLLFLFIFKEIDLINAIFYGWTTILFFVLIYFKKVYKLKIFFDTSRIKLLLRAGFPQLIYAFSYVLMTLMTRTLVGIYYPVEVMGYITLAISVTTAIMLGLDTITWLIFPTMINKMCDVNLKGDKLTKFIVNFSNKLVNIVFIIVSLCILILPVLFHFLSEYKPVHFTLIVLLVNQIIINAAFLLASLCVSRKLYLQLALTSIFGVVVSTSMSLFFSFHNFPFIWLVFSNVVGSLLFFNFLLNYVSRKFKLKSNELRKFFNWDIQISFLVIILLSVFELYYLVLLIIMILLFLKRKFMLSLSYDIFNILKK